MAHLDHEPPVDDTPTLPVEPAVGWRVYRIALSDQNLIDVVAALRFMELRLQMNHHPRRTDYTNLANRFAKMTENRRTDSLIALGMVAANA